MKKNVVILGAGFGGIYTFLKLRPFLKSERLQVTIINRHNYFLFTPMLHEVATGGLTQLHSVQAIRELIHGYNADLYVSEATKIDPEKKIVQTKLGDVSYDYLVIATGAETNFFGAKGALEHTFQLKDLSDAVHIRNHIINEFEAASKIEDSAQRRDMLSFAVVGGGPTGVELAAEMADFFYETFEKLYKNIVTINEVSLYLVNSGDVLLKQFPKVLGKRAEKMLKKKHVKIVPNAHATEVTKKGLLLDTGETVPAKNVIWVAGVKPCMPEIIKPFELSKSGRIVVDEYFRVKGHTDIFAIGDVAACTDPSGHELPMLAQVAVRQAETLAHNIVADLHERPYKKFEYKSLGSLVSLGKLGAVGDILGLQLSGWYVWHIWRGVYWYKSPGLAKKLKIGMDWFIELFYPRDIAKRH